MSSLIHRLKSFGHKEADPRNFKSSMGVSIAGHVAVGTAGYWAVSRINSENHSQANKREPATLSEYLQNEFGNKRSVLDKLQSELKPRAEKTIANWKKTKEMKIDSLGTFLLEVDLVTSREPLSNVAFEIAVENYQKDLSLIREKIANLPSSDGPNSWKAQLETVSNHLWPRSRVYCGSAARLTNYYERECGNCEAQTKLILATIYDLGISIPKPYRLGIQRYSNHVVPVLIDTSQNKVLDLVVHEELEDEEIRDVPILDPISIVEGYLRKFMNYRPLPLSQLLIYNPPPSKSKGRLNLTSTLSLRTDTNLEFPSSHGPSFNGSAPEFGILHKGKKGDKKGQTQGRGEIGQNGEPKRPFEVRIATAEEKSKMASQSFIATEWYPGTRTLIFKDQGLWAQWNSLKNSDDRQFFLAGLIRKDLRELRGQKGLQAWNQILENPSNVSNFSEEEIQEIVFAFEGFASIYLSSLKASYFENEFGALSDIVPSSWKVESKHIKQLQYIISRDPSTFLHLFGAPSTAWCF